MKLPCLAANLALLLCLVFTSFAQVTAIEGTVKAADGRLIRDAVIKITRTDIKQQYQVKTDRNGHYSYRGLPIGTYTLSCEVDGIQVGNANNVKTHPGAPLLTDFDMGRTAEESVSKLAPTADAAGAISPSMVMPNATQGGASGIGAMQTGILVIRGDSDGTLSIDGGDSGLIRAGQFLRVTTVAGEHFLEVRGVGNGCKWEKKVTVPSGMQVAEQVDFDASCTSKPVPVFERQPGKTSSDNPERGATASGGPNAAALLVRGCLLFELMQSKEAVTVLEQATALMGRDAPCLENARASLQRARAAISDCGQPNAKRQDCNTLMPIAKMMNGESAEVFESLNSYIQAHEPDQFPSHNAATLYQMRALNEYAMRNTGAALRDLKRTLDWYQRENGPGEDDTHFYRAVMLIDVGNVSEAKDECKLAMAFPKFVGFKRDVFCARLIDGSLLQLTAVPGPTPQGSIAQEIDDLVKSGQYVALPLPVVQPTGTAPAGSALLNVQNTTAYTLTVLLSGPDERRVDVAPRSSSPIKVISGPYRVVVRANGADVLPSYGRHEFAGVASIDFYIQ